MVEVASIDFRNETRNYLLDKTKHNDLMSEKQKKTCKYLNYVEHFASIVWVSVGITSSAVGSKHLRNICRNQKV